MCLWYADSRPEQFARVAKETALALLQQKDFTLTDAETLFTGLKLIGEGNTAAGGRLLTGFCARNDFARTALLITVWMSASATGGSPP